MKRSTLRRLARRRLGLIGYAGPTSDHFDGERFFNPGASQSKRRADVKRWLNERPADDWQRDLTPIATAAPAARVEDLAITWIGHASVLVQAAGLNLLFDPVLSYRAGPLPGVGAPRYRPPGLTLDQLPPIDAVAISHAHYDHLDRPTIVALARRFSPRLIAGLGLADWLHQAGARRIDCCDWWQRIELGGGCAQTFTPARHWSRRGIDDRNRSLWGGYMLDTPAGRVYFAGDTGWGDHFTAVRERLGAPRVALLPIGAYEPRWFMGPQHMNPADAVAAHRALGAEQSIGIHFATFRLADERQQAPASDLAAARRAAGLNDAEFVAPGFGQRFEYARREGA